MNTAKVVMQNGAACSLLASAFATFDVECIGIVLGEAKQEKSGRVFFAEWAFPYQKAERKPREVVHDNGEKARLNHFLRNRIGGFHLHPTSLICKDKIRLNEYGVVWLSEDDRVYMKKHYPEGIELVVGTKPINRICPIRAGEFTFSGSVEYRGRLYRLEAGAYCLDGSQRKRRAAIEISKKDLERYLI